MADYLNLDFNAIKQDIKDYIKDNSEVLADYNYEGSAISSMINVLSYATQYNMHYLNMIATELSITTAKKASNIYKLANMLNYLPKRNVSPYIDVEVTNISNGVRYVNLGNKFESNNVSLIYMGDTVTIPPGETKTIKLNNGEFVTKNWLSDGRAFQKYQLEDREKIDNNLFYVGVSDSPADLDYSWENINVTNPVVGGKYYYIDYLDTMNIKFDDGSVYKKPLSEQTVSTMYLRTEGTKFNGYVQEGDEIDTQNSDLEVVAVSDLDSGEDAESLEEIKARAVLMFTTQNRAITKRDYYNLFNYFPKITEYESYSIYGGNDIWLDVNGYEIEKKSVGAWADTGFVYFSIIKKPEQDDIYNFEYLKDSEENEISEYFFPYKVITIFFKFVYPVIVYMKPKIRLELKSYVGVELDVLEDNINNEIYERYSGMDKSFNWSNLVNWLDGLEAVECCEVEYNVRALVKKDEDITYKIVPLSNPVKDIWANYAWLTYDGYDININDVIYKDPDYYLVTSVSHLEGNDYFSYKHLGTDSPGLIKGDTVEIQTPNQEVLGTAYVERANRVYINEVTQDSDIYLEDSLDPESGVQTIETSKITNPEVIFANWHRFSHNTNTEVQPASPSELEGWVFDPDSGKITSTINSVTYIGFVSDQRYDYYSHEVLLQADDWDNDLIGVIIAYAEDLNGHEHTLSAVRIKTTQSMLLDESDSSLVSWAIVYNFNQSTQKIIANGTTLAGAPDNSTWGSTPHGTRVRVERNKDSVTAWTSLFSDTTATIDSNTQLSVDLTSDPDLEIFRGTKQIGYSCFSQPSSTFAVEEFNDITTASYETEYVIGTVNCDTGFVKLYDMENTLLKFMEYFVIDVELEDDISFDVERELFLCPEEAEFEYIY